MCHGIQKNGLPVILLLFTDIKRPDIRMFASLLFTVSLLQTHSYYCPIYLHAIIKFRGNEIKEKNRKHGTKDNIFVTADLIEKRKPS